MSNVLTKVHRETRFFIAWGIALLIPAVCAAQARQTDSLAAAIAAIEAGRMTTPLVSEPGADGDVTVTFLAERRGGRVPRIVSDVTGWGEHIDGTFDFTVGRMTRVGKTRWYILRAQVAPRARVEYLIAYGRNDYRQDPHNPRRSAGPERGGVAASEFVTRGYVAPEEFAAAPPATGRLTEAGIESRAPGGTRAVVVYTPREYRAGGEYPLVIILSVRTAPISRVLDWLIGKELIEPVVAVLAGPPATPDFLARELLPWITARYAVSSSPERRAIIGISYGAKDALDAAVRPGGAFRHLGLLIPGRRITRRDLEAVSARAGERVRVAILAGRYDSANLPTARGLRDALAGAGHTVHYTEVPEGHSTVTWTNHLRAVLVGLFPGPAL